jgi:hypothetical protein
MDVDRRLDSEPIEDENRGGIAIAAATDDSADTAGGLARREDIAPRLIEGVVSAVDGYGTGYVGLVSFDRGELVAVGFRCGVIDGILDFVGRSGIDETDVAAFLGDLVDRAPGGVVARSSALASSILGGCILINQSLDRNDLRDGGELDRWISRTLGADFRPRPFLASASEADPSAIPHADLVERVREILDACPDWLDRSPLTAELAAEILLRERSLPDPARDLGAYRYLFEHAIQKRLELDRRSLLWMSLVWSANDLPRRADAARTLAWQLSDPQHIVPGHPYIIELCTRSLAAAQLGLK